MIDIEDITTKQINIDFLKDLISSQFNSEKDFQSIKAMFYKDSSSAYKIS